MQWIKYASLPYHSRSLILITKEHKLAELFVTEAHHGLKHMKTKQTLTELGQLYWISSGRNFVKRILHKCVTIIIDGKP